MVGYLRKKNKRDERIVYPCRNIEIQGYLKKSRKICIFQEFKFFYQKIFKNISSNEEIQERMATLKLQRPLSFKNVSKNSIVSQKNRYISRL